MVVRRRVARRRVGRKRRMIRRPYGRVTGHGGYWGDFGRQVLTGGGSALGAWGGLAGGPVGSVIGGAAGGTIGSGIADVIGLGDYAVNSNSLYPMAMGMEVPSVKNFSSNTFCLSHREFIGDVIAPASPTAFNLVSYRLQAGAQGTFPWLANIADNFEQYRFTGMLFEFKSLSSEYATGSALGAVIMATDYDSADANFANKSEMENTQYSTSGKPSINIVHAIECAPGLTTIPNLFINTTSVPTGKDIRLYDLGNFQIATQGLSASAGQVLGELWVSYEVCLMKPILSPSSNSVAHFELPTTVSTSHYLGADTSTITNAVSTTAQFGYCQNSAFIFNNGAPLGYYLVLYNVVGASTALTTGMGYTRSDSTSIGIYNYFSSAGSDFVSLSAAGVTDTTQGFIAAIKLNSAINTSGNSSKITISTGTLPGTITEADLTVMYFGSQAPF